MLGQRRPLGTRVDSRKNTNSVIDKNQNLKGALVDKTQNLKNVSVDKPQNLKTGVAKAFTFEKPKPVTKTLVKKRTYGGRSCLVSEELANDIDNYLQYVEKLRRIEPDFLKNAQIDGRMRGILLDWLMQIQAKFGMLAETFYLATLILDRVIVAMEVTRQNFQLIGLVCIFIAAKFEEIMIPNVQDFIYLSGEFCTIEELFKAERDVLRALKFHLTFTYPSHFMRKLRLLSPPGPEHAKCYEIAKILIDVAIIDYNTSTWLQSETSATAFYLSYEIAKHSCPKELLENVGVTTMDIVEKSKVLGARLAVYADQQGKLQGLRLKYKNTDALDTIDKYITSLKTLNSQ